MERELVKETVAGRIRLLRVYFKYTQKQLAKAIGTKPSAISNYERGLKLPSLHKLFRFCEFFGMDFEFFDPRIVNKARLVNIISTGTPKFKKEKVDARSTGLSVKAGSKVSSLAYRE